MIFGTHEQNTIEQYNDVASRAAMAALMADGHLGYVMPIGGVAAYHNKVSVVGVGFDIACGNCAVKTDRVLGDFTPKDLEAVAHDITRTFDFGVGGSNRNEFAPGGEFIAKYGDIIEGIIPPKHSQRFISKARNQLGTIGSGNHYVDIFADQDNAVWVGVHFGSRGFGHMVASAFLSLSQGGRWDERGNEAEVLLDLENPLGADYWTLMELAGQYAYDGRNWVCDTAARRVLGSGPVLDRVHNNHNFAWRETHRGQDLIVVRKGATPAFPGQRGFVGGSMGDDSVILQGADGEGSVAKIQQRALYSTVHGAGRVMGRSAAKGKRDKKTGDWKREPQVIRSEVDEWLARVGVIVKGGDLDEAPQAYRRLDDVLEAQGDTINVTHRLRPLIVCMAS